MERIEISELCEIAYLFGLARDKSDILIESEAELSTEEMLLLYEKIHTYCIAFGGHCSILSAIHSIMDDIGKLENIYKDFLNLKDNEDD